MENLFFVQCNAEFSSFVFSRNRTEYGDLQSKSTYPEGIQKYELEKTSHLDTFHVI